MQKKGKRQYGLVQHVKAMIKGRVPYSWLYLPMVNLATNRFCFLRAQGKGNQTKKRGIMIPESWLSSRITRDAMRWRSMWNKPNIFSQPRDRLLISDSHRAQTTDRINTILTHECQAQRARFNHFIMLSMQNFRRALTLSLKSRAIYEWKVRAADRRVFFTKWVARCDKRSCVGWKTQLCIHL